MDSITGTTSVDGAVATLRDWLLERVAAYLPDVEEPISPRNPLGEYGLDSIVVLALAADIEDHLAISLDPTALWDYSTVDQLTVFLLDECVRQKSQI
ncbi:acyl carrier protein [Micromonospora sp. NPDC048894]|uniref:acyl carrier protein n=1 Tax=Micromonospora sp. NPDC048894 TaxID=3155493 RepID=UPI0033D7AD3A